MEFFGPGKYSIGLGLPVGKRSPIVCDFCVDGGGRCQNPFLTDGLSSSEVDTEVGKRIKRGDCFFGHSFGYGEARKTEYVGIFVEDGKFHWRVKKRNNQIDPNFKDGPATKRDEVIPPLCRVCHFCRRGECDRSLLQDIAQLRGVSIYHVMDEQSRLFRACNFGTKVRNPESMIHRIFSVRFGLRLEQDGRVVYSPK